MDKGGIWFCVEWISWTYVCQLYTTVKELMDIARLISWQLRHTFCSEEVIQLKYAFTFYGATSFPSLKGKIADCFAAQTWKSDDASS